MRNKILMIISFVVVALFLNSCLKDDVGLDWTSSLKGKMYAEVWQGGFQALALDPVPDTVTFKFLVNIASDQPPTQDITVTLGVDADAIAKYNDLNGSDYQLFPNINILDKSLVIKAGTRNAYAHVQVWGADQLNACDNFMAPIAITDATGGVIPADPVNMGARLMALPIANPYAGSYHVVGYRIHPSYADPFTVDMDEQLSTVNCSTVLKHYMGDYPYDVSIQITDQTMVVSGVTCYKVIVHTMDPATGALIAGEGMETTFTGNLAYPPAPPTSDVNYYNPDTKQFVLNYYYASPTPRIAYEILTRN